MRGVVNLFIMTVAAAVSLTACDRPENQVAPPASTQAIATSKPVFAAYAGSQSCRECHEPAHNDWLKSHHALAERAVDPAHGDVPMPGAPAEPVRVIGHDPLRQFLFPGGGG